MPDDLKRTYDALQYFGVTDIGTFDEFTSRMQNPIDRRKTYEALEYFGVDDLGEYENWEMRFQSKVPESTLIDDISDPTLHAFQN